MHLHILHYRFLYSALEVDRESECTPISSLTVKIMCLWVCPNIHRHTHACTHTHTQTFSPNLASQTDFSHTHALAGKFPHKIQLVHETISALTLFLSMNTDTDDVSPLLSLVASSYIPLLASTLYFQCCHGD